MESMNTTIRRWRELNPEKYRAQKARWRERHPDRKRGSDDTHKRARAKWAAANPEKEREVKRESAKRMQPKRNEQQRQARRTPEGRRREKASRLKANYGITHEQYDAMYSSQGGTCAICRKLETRVIRGALTPLTVDHDHSTGAVRQLLCHRCNASIGFMDESPSRMRAMAAYVEAHRSIPLISTWKSPSLAEVEAASLPRTDFDFTAIDRQALADVWFPRRAEDGGA